MSKKNFMAGSLKIAGQQLPKALSGNYCMCCCAPKAPSPFSCMSTGASSEGAVSRVDTSMMTLRRFAHRLDAIWATTAWYLGDLREASG
jgi:hypothetical protein